MTTQTTEKDRPLLHDILVEPIVVRPQGLQPSPDSMDWQDQALCAQTDPEVFFGVDGSDKDRATALCLECPVRKECLDYAMQNIEEHGIWGATTPAQRRSALKAAGGLYTRTKLDKATTDERALMLVANGHTATEAAAILATSVRYIERAKASAKAQRKKEAA